MSADLVPLVGPYVTAAVGAYGASVLARSQDAAADATVGLGRRILQRIFGTRDDGEQAPEVLAELAAEPGDEDLQAVLRVHIRKALAADTDLAREIRAMLADAPEASGASVRATGNRSIAAQTISGTAITGDVSLGDSERP